MTLRDQIVLVTGADGFIGSHLSQALLKLGCKVKALSCYNSFNNWGWLEEFRGEKNLEVLTGDIRDPHYCREISKDTDIIFHLAALIAIPFSYSAPDSYIDTNIKGTLNICQAAKENGCKKVIHTSTSEVYGSARYVPIDENHPLQPQSPYSASKIGADALAMSFYNSFDLPLTIARPFNTYGPRQSARAVIPTIIAQGLTTKNNTIKLGSLSPIRDFNYVQDTVNGFIKIAETDNIAGEIFNLGSGKGVTIGEVAQIIIERINPKIKILSDEQRVRPEKSEVLELLCNSSKANDVLGWKPEYSIETGLTYSIEFIKSHLNFYKPDIYNI